MNIIWFSWKDIRHPQAGGAETVSHEIMRRLVEDGHSVSLITSEYPGSGEEKTHEGVNIYYCGGRYSVYTQARKLYLNKLKGTEDLVVDEMNTIPFLAATYTSASKKILLAYQLAREVWFYQMLFPLSLVGYVVEPAILRLVGYNYKIAVTESESSKIDMKKHGISNVGVFRVGMAMTPLKKLAKKTNKNTVLSLGSVRPMKRTLHAVRAFEYARDINPELKLVVAGDISSSYARKVLNYINHSRHSSAISVLGRVSVDDRTKLMQESGAILVTSVKEGWGLIVTEANSQGTPAVAYNVDGLRDSVSDKVTGVITPTNPRAMGSAIVELLRDPNYEVIRKKAWEKSHEYTFDNSYSDFKALAGIN